MDSCISRRGFLLGIAAAAAAPGNLFAKADKDFDSSLAVFLSDVHVNGLDELNGKKTKTSMREHLAANVAEILRMNPLPRHVFIFGDLAHLQGRLVDYRRSYPDLKLLADAGIGLTIGMGNHDHRKAFLEVWPEYQERTLVPGAIHTVTSLPDYDLVMLDSLNEKDEVDAWNPTAGALSKAAQEWILSRLPKWPRPFFIGAHHPIYELKFGGRQKALARLHREIPELPRLHTRPRPHLENECRQLARTQDRTVADAAVQRLLGRHRICSHARRRQQIARTQSGAGEIRAEGFLPRQPRRAGETQSRMGCQTQ